MGSASRTALATGVAALAAANGVTLTTGEELLAAARAIDGSSQLRALLSDPTLDATDRNGLVETVFASLGAATRELLGGLTASRWSNGAQLVDGVEELGIRAIAKAQATTTDIVSELFAVDAAVRSDVELELALGSKLAAPGARAAVVDGLLAKQGSPATIAIVEHLVRSPRGRRIGALLQHTAQIVAETAGGIVARVTVAAPLSAAQERSLTADLATQFGGAPRIQYIVDPAVIGGVRVRVGDTVIDGTLATRLADLRLQLAG